MFADEQPDFDVSGPGSRTMTRVYLAIEALAEQHPQWYEKFESTDFNTCEALELVAMMDTAPSDTARGFLAGAMASRMALSTLTGRPLF